VTQCDAPSSCKFVSRSRSRISRHNQSDWNIWASLHTGVLRPIRSDGEALGLGLLGGFGYCASYSPPPSSSRPPAGNRGKARQQTDGLPPEIDAEILADRVTLSTTLISRAVRALTPCRTADASPPVQGRAQVPGGEVCTGAWAVPTALSHCAVPFNARLLRGAKTPGCACESTGQRQIFGGHTSTKICHIVTKDAVVNLAGWRHYATLGQFLDGPFTIESVAVSFGPVPSVK
jgi:hypothetical protein